MFSGLESGGLLSQKFQQMPFLYTFIYFLSILASSQGKLSADECLSMGFTSELQCHSCDKLEEFGLGVIEENCLKCCQPDKDADVKKFHGAVLEVCQWKLGRYPQVQAFIKSDRPKAFPNLQIKYVRGKDPTVFLMDENGKTKETLSVEKWDTDNIEEFFNEKLI